MSSFRPEIRGCFLFFNYCSELIINWTELIYLIGFIYDEQNKYFYFYFPTPTEVFTVAMVASNCLVALKCRQCLMADIRALLN